ncbi:hypothetical protein [Hymenobacter profundi]|uniref:Outer membrane protein beta-barrel domain-containing protein n=1 Tax=Hymenobacter profundi TaxID=1982110 RepID=A0ABS6WWH4_9BACT|nr:hypothetical protein [Hymenobacter profundi]MBW3127789.1 hypothetical protein [Hymenobacter profundi]
MLNFYKVAGLVAALCVSSLSAVAQRPASIQLGVGSALVGTGDYKALKAHVEYAPLFGRHLGTGTRLAFIGGSRESFSTVFDPIPRPGSTGINVPYAMTYQAANLEHEFYLYPFGNNRQVLFAVGGGGYVGYSNRYGAPQTRWDAGLGGAVNYLEHEQGVHAGYMLSLNLDVALGIDRQWLAGGKASFQNDTFGNTLATLQLKVGRRF